MELFEQSPWGFNFLCKNVFPVKKKTHRSKGRMVAMSALHPNVGTSSKGSFLPGGFRNIFEL